MTQSGMKKLVFKLGTLAVLVGMLFVAPLAAHGYGKTCNDLCFDQYKVCLDFCKQTRSGLLCQLQCTADKLVCQALCEL
ncbi:MAG: hypothetical protein ACRD2X_15905 [Vicinamibacteraceae bacterium]